jgi:hypothetical protein
MATLNHNHAESVPAAINGYKINGLTPLNNHKREVLLDDID